MAGRKQHYIPQCFLKGFRLQKKGRTGKVWVFKKGQPPYISSIEDVAAARYFYSGVPDDISLTLDDKITQYENKLSELINIINESPMDCNIDSAIAAEIIIHLTMRGAYLRDIFNNIFKEVVTNIIDTFVDKELIRKLMGLNRNNPSPVIKGQIEELLSKYPLLTQLGLPSSALNQIMFTLMREWFDQFHSDQLPIFLKYFNELPLKAGTIARNEHTKVLADELKGNARFSIMSQLIWTITEFPEGDLILPDCVAVSIKNDGITFDPYMMANLEEINIIMMPVCATKILIGRQPNSSLPDMQVFNEAAAVCSHTFFVSSHKTLQLESLAERIGEHSEKTLLDSLRFGFMEGLAQIKAEHEFKLAPHSVGNHDLPEKNIKTDFSEKRDSNIISYPVNFIDCADQETAKEIAAAVNDIVSEMSHFIPVNRLEFITFAKDYKSALQDIDRGFSTSKPLIPTFTDFGVGVAMAPIIIRDGVVKVCIVLQAWVGHALICSDIEAQSMAIHTLAGQLAHVACIEIIDRNLPGMLTRPITNDWEAWLSSQMLMAFTGYAAARISAGFNPIINSGNEDMLATVIERMQEAIHKERLVYRFHGDLNHFLEIAIDSISLMITYAGSLLGHYDGLDESICGVEGKLMESLEKNGLKAWMNILRHDFDGLFKCFGEWESIQEFQALNRHIERILWQFGVFPWSNDEGQVRIEIPLSTDAAQLIKIMSHFQ